jgi:hypothetical protein
MQKEKKKKGFSTLNPKISGRRVEWQLTNERITGAPNYENTLKKKQKLSKPRVATVTVPPTIIMNEIPVPVKTFSLCRVQSPGIGTAQGQGRTR